MHQKAFADITKTVAAETPMLEVAKACARTAVDLLTDPKLLSDAWDELRRRQAAENTPGDGVGKG